MKLSDLIAAAPWREAAIYGNIWSHDYVVLQKGDQRELLEAVSEMVCDGEGFCVAYLLWATCTCSSAITSTG